MHEHLNESNQNLCVPVGQIMNKSLIDVMASKNLLNVRCTLDLVTSKRSPIDLMHSGVAIYQSDKHDPYKGTHP